MFLTYTKIFTLKYTNRYRTLVAMNIDLAKKFFATFMYKSRHIFRNYTQYNANESTTGGADTYPTNFDA